MTYRKLSETELLNLGLGPRQTKTDIARLTNYIKNFFPANAAQLRFEAHSEYNDSTYDNTLIYVAVLDSTGKELAPLPGKERAARAAAKDLPFNKHESNDPLEDWQEPLPGGGLELYVKED
jgi:hypothetical protein